ncbi:SpoIIE family protein phosphatase [Oligoflexaceae bacterium]|nr:SpoIIE family protein phosphatase [Oligoflexaceae bacterium]
MSDDQKALAQRWHDRRRLSNPTEGNRTLVPVATVGFLLTMMILYLSSLIWGQFSSDTKIDSLPHFSKISSGELIWTVKSLGTDDCSPSVTACAKKLRLAPVIYKGPKLETINFEQSFPDDSKKRRWLLVSTEVSPKYTSNLNPKSTWTFGFPMLAREKIEAFVNGRYVQTVYPKEPSSFSFEPESSPERGLQIELIVSQKPSFPLLLNPKRTAEYSFVAHVGDLEELVAYESVQKATSGDVISSIAHVVLAVFCMLLFLLVDSSPESLGLAIYMGAYSLVYAIGSHWVGDYLIPKEYQSLAWSFVLGFAAVMKVYFFSQLSRLAKPNLKPWLVGGVLVAAFYTIPWLIDPSELLGTGFIRWKKHFWSARNLISGFLCVGLAIAAASTILRDPKLRWRIVALAIACLGVTISIVSPVVGYFPWILGTPEYQSIYYVLAASAPYLFALSTFINISTLENRVKTLSKALASKFLIEEEMKLGQTVQQSFLRLPELPRKFGIACHHQAAVYVSGDTYYFNWDEKRGSLVMLLTDVTGHGVQAALKASICSAIADSIWGNSNIRKVDGHSNRFEIYRNRLSSFLEKSQEASEMLSICGFEYDESSDIAHIYRMHGVFPIVVKYRKENAGYEVSTVAIEDKETVSQIWNRGDFVIFISDGLVDCSRDYKKLILHLDEGIQKFSGPIDEESVKEIFFTFDSFNQVLDDKTFLLIHRRLEAE